MNSDGLPVRPYPRAGLVSLACYAAHGGYHLFHGRPEDLLWACHLGAVLIGTGLIVPSAVISGVGTMQLCLGTPLWILYLLGGGEFMPTSMLTHVVALVIGLFAVRQCGMPKGTAWKSVATLVFLIVVSRLVTPAEANVNVAFAVQSGWEDLFPSYRVYIAVMVGMAGVYFLVLEYVLRRWWVRSSPKEPSA